MRTLLARLVIVVSILCLGSVCLAQAPETRIALVIGNSHYTAVSPLPNPTSDAQTVAQALRAAGFNSVQVENNLGFDAMRRALHDFSAKAETADWAVVYYAGHGIEVGGINFVIPVDARLKTDRDVAFEAVPLDQVLSSIEGARKLRLVILDACRDNPFLQQMTGTLATRSIGRGLARIEPEGGTLVAYAAKHGQVALDGKSQNSPFVAALIKHIQTPGLEINMLFRAVRDDVLRATGRKQEPFVYGSLPNASFYFVTASQPAMHSPYTAQPPMAGTTRPKQRGACDHSLGAAIYAKWQQLGERGGVLGCPVMSETEAMPSPQGTRGTIAEFGAGDGGAILLHASGSRAGQAYEVHGCNFKLFRQLGGSGGRLGFPISDEYDVPGGRRSDFEGGYIQWEAKTRICAAYDHP